jgi:hypothetical protein
VRATVVRLALLALLVSGCAPRAAVAGASASPKQKRVSLTHKTLEYSFALDRELHTLTARMCPTGALPAQLVCGMRDARNLLKSVAIERGTERIALTLDEQGVDLAQLERGDCVRYELDLQREGRGMGAPRLQRSGGSLMANIAALLWRPIDYVSYAEVSARFEAPEGVRISVPWPKDPAHAGRYTLDASAFAFHAYAAFGELTTRELRVAGSAIELAILDGFSPEQEEAIARWTLKQAEAAALLGGRLPRKRIQLVVLPSDPSSDPIRFGSMTRGGGASAGVLVASNFDERALMGDWVLVHELSHLLHPFVNRNEAWFSEGIATYYQEVLRARAGLQPVETAWRRILSGSKKGDSMDISLERGAATMYETYHFAPVYWGGAAVMLLADVELRQKSNGARSLDDVLMELSSCCSKGSRPWSSSEVAERFDAIAGAPIMRELIARVVRGETFPRLGALYEQLGVDREGRPVAGAPLSGIRDAIMRAPETSLRLATAGGTTPPP